MTIAKTTLLEMISRMPDSIDIDDLIYSLYLKKKVELGEKDIEAGRVMTHENVVMETEKWLGK
jgi:predicted transcriptional regulator